jgi:non-canonical purine NTP pyrophosphatase (RdgB/HAM1 family)
MMGLSLTAPAKKLRVVYVTSSKFKRDENQAFVEYCTLDDAPVKDQVEFVFRDNRIQEELEANLEVMVCAEVRRAYAKVRVPCIVEHAGLVFEEYATSWYPGGLTKPMWDILKARFVQETNSADRRALARAVVAYCDGKAVRTFVGETRGRIAKRPRGRREFYWDTVFIPDDPETGKKGRRTYAEICEDPKLGLPHKMKSLSQSAKAMLKFLQFLKQHPHPDLWAV